VALRRLFAATVVCASVVLGISLLVGSGRAAPSRTTTHTCSAPDRQFVATVSTNMQQLDYWARELGSKDASPMEVIKQARAEALQVEATGPTDPSLRATRSLIGKMLREYALAVRAHALGGNAGKHMGIAYELANYVHQVLVEAQPDLQSKGCDLAPLLTA
jgi:hypothetical protein